MTLYEQEFGNSGKEKTPFRNKPSAESGSGRGNHLQGQKMHCRKDQQINNN